MPWEMDPIRFLLLFDPNSIGGECAEVSRRESAEVGGGSDTERVWWRHVIQRQYLATV
jgi:hypothetical protein